MQRGLETNGRSRASVAPKAASKAAYRICTTCVMDTSDSAITFDATGRCAHCTLYEQYARYAGWVAPADRPRLLAEAIAKMKAAGKGRRYDCVIGLSGGVDSSYVALKVKQLGLRPLAVHLDNGWNSETAVNNIERVVRGLGIDLHTCVLDWEEFRDLQLAFLRAATPDYEIPTDHAILATVFKAAWRLRIPCVVLGSNIATELVLPTTWAQGHQDWWYIRSVHARFGTRPLRTFPHLDAVEYFRFRRNCARRSLNILNYSEYSRTRATDELERSIGWRNYYGKHYESIYTRFIQGYVLPRKFGIDKRRAHLSSSILYGLTTRADALASLETPTYESEDQLEQDRGFFLKKLGLSEGDFEAIMTAPPHTGVEFDSLLGSRPYAAARSLYRAARSLTGA